MSSPTLVFFSSKFAVCLWFRSIDAFCIPSHPRYVVRRPYPELRYDPELLVGYDVERASWGYLVNRAACFQRQSFPRELSRLAPGKWSKSIFVCLLSVGCAFVIIRRCFCHALMLLAVSPWYCRSCYCWILLSANWDSNNNGYHISVCIHSLTRRRRTVLPNARNLDWRDLSH